MSRHHVVVLVPSPAAVQHHLNYQQWQCGKLNRHRSRVIADRSRYYQCSKQHRKKTRLGFDFDCRRFEYMTHDEIIAAVGQHQRPPSFSLECRIK